LDQQRDDDLSNYIFLRDSFVHLQGVAVADSCWIGRPIDTLLVGLIACPVEGDKIPDTSSKLESSREAKQDIIGADESIFTENGTKEARDW